MIQEWAMVQTSSISDKVIDDIIALTGCHAGLVCMCGRALDVGRSFLPDTLDINLWKMIYRTNFRQ